jgi:hypothetical protein
VLEDEYSNCVVWNSVTISSPIYPISKSANFCLDSRSVSKASVIVSAVSTPELRVN